MGVVECPLHTCLCLFNLVHACRLVCGPLILAGWSAGVACVHTTWEPFGHVWVHIYLPAATMFCRLSLPCGLAACVHSALALGPFRIFSPPSWILGVVEVGAYVTGFGILENWKTLPPPYRSEYHPSEYRPSKPFLLRFFRRLL